MIAATNPLRIAVVGLGPMGQRHARTIAAHPHARLVMAVECDPSRAKMEIGCPIVAASDDLVGQVDAAVLAVPTAAHAAVAVPLLKAGIHCLIEKPFVASPVEADRIREAAQAGGAVVRVGHIERFNPAIDALFVKAPRDIRAISARRISGASARVTDIDVVMDLMVHDLDIVLALKPTPVQSVAAAGTRDHATALITFADGALATVTASRIAPLRVRDLDVFADDTALHVDYVARTLGEYRRGSGDAATSCEVPMKDALTEQLSAFLKACAGAATPVTADEARAVMDLAWRIQAALTP